jgi:hypothetical protein
MVCGVGSGWLDSPVKPENDEKRYGFLVVVVVIVIGF